MTGSLRPFLLPHILLVCSLALLAAPPSPAAAAPAADPEAVLAAIRAARLDPARAVEVRNLALDAGLARLRIDHGVLVPAVPAEPAAGAISELVFLGTARLVLEPPDDIERGQLELFTGAPRLEAEVTEAAMTVADDAAVAAILGRAAGAAHDTARAEEIFRTWRSSAERRQLDIETGTLVDALGDPLYRTYFAGRFRTTDLGDFLYLVEPWAGEPVTLGQFVALDATEKERRRIARHLHRTQRRGRLIGLTLDDLGQWDTWLSAPLGSGAGARNRPAPFEPRAYQLDLRLEGRDLDLAGRARIELVAGVGGSSAVRLRLHSDLTVDGVTDAAGRPLWWRRNGDGVLVWLDTAPAAGETATLEVAYRGKLIEKAASGSFALADTLGWYPHAGELDLATYDVTFHWPDRLDLVGGGTRVDGGAGEDGTRWERRRLDVPSVGFSFEVGKFKTVTARAGHVEITLAFEPATYPYLKDGRDELLDTLTGSLTYFEEVFGPYPLDQLTVVTVPRSYSQAMLGFITLSTLMMSDVDLLTVVLGLEDRRTVIAHELAHEWWGHRMGWRSYRDQWISEAMANYAALLYARNRLGGELRFAMGPTAGWQRALGATTADGRPVESLGPLVLGARLVSSHSGEAYEAIVYRKGAVVLDMLSRLYGEERFLQVLAAALEQAGGKPVSTEEFFALLGRLSGVDLEPFARQFVYSTGLPEVYYDYRFAPGEAGKWKVELEARQRSPHRWRYRVVERPGGGFDVAREAVVQMDVGDSMLAVPFQIAVVGAEAAAGGGKGKRGKGSGAAMQALNGRLLLRGETTTMDMEIDYEPRELWLDRGNEVFGRFFNRRRSPKQVRLYDGIDRLAAGDAAGAEAALREALGAPVASGLPLPGEELDERDRERLGWLLDGVAQMTLARLYLDQDRDAEARTAMDAAARLLDRAGRQGDRALVSLEARLALRAGDPDRALKLLRKAILKRGDLDSTEGFVLLAIAARANGDEATYRTAADTAREKGADLTLLGGPATAARDQ
jgi:hypothetical protein